MHTEKDTFQGRCSWLRVGLSQTFLRDLIKQHRFSPLLQSSPHFLGGPESGAFSVGHRWPCCNSCFSTSLLPSVFRSDQDTGLTCIDSEALFFFKIAILSLKRKETHMKNINSSWKETMCRDRNIQRSIELEKKTSPMGFPPAGSSCVLSELNPCRVL